MIQATVLHPGFIIDEINRVSAEPRYLELAMALTDWHELPGHDCDDPPAEVGQMLAELKAMKVEAFVRAGELPGCLGRLGGPPALGGDPAHGRVAGAARHGHPVRGRATGADHHRLHLSGLRRKEAPDPPAWSGASCYVGLAASPGQEDAAPDGRGEHSRADQHDQDSRELLVPGWTGHQRPPSRKATSPAADTSRRNAAR
jgi:hypothetical protein